MRCAVHYSTQLPLWTCLLSRVPHLVPLFLSRFHVFSALLSLHQAACGHGDCSLPGLSGQTKDLLTEADAETCLSARGSILRARVPRNRKRAGGKLSFAVGETFIPKRSWPNFALRCTALYSKVHYVHVGATCTDTPASPLPYSATNSKSPLQTLNLDPASECLRGSRLRLHLMLHRPQVAGCRTQAMPPSTKSVPCACPLLAAAGAAAVSAVAAHPQRSTTLSHSIHPTKITAAVERHYSARRRAAPDLPVRLPSLSSLLARCRHHHTKAAPSQTNHHSDLFLFLPLPLSSTRSALLSIFISDLLSTVAS